MEFIKKENWNLIMMFFDNVLVFKVSVFSSRNIIFVWREYVFYIDFRFFF